MTDLKIIEQCINELKELRNEISERYQDEQSDEGAKCALFCIGDSLDTRISMLNEAVNDYQDEKEHKYAYDCVEAIDSLAFVLREDINDNDLGLGERYIKIMLEYLARLSDMLDRYKNDIVEE